LDGRKRCRSQAGIPKGALPAQRVERLFRWAGSLKIVFDNTDKIAPPVPDMTLSVQSISGEGYGVFYIAANDVYLRWLHINDDVGMTAKAVCGAISSIFPLMKPIVSPVRVSTAHPIFPIRLWLCLSVCL
jgi:hypothetical protein